VEEKGAKEWEARGEKEWEGRTGEGEERKGEVNGSKRERT